MKDKLKFSAVCKSNVYIRTILQERYIRQNRVWNRNKNTWLIIVDNAGLWDLNLQVSIHMASKIQLKSGSGNYFVVISWTNVT